MRALENVKYSNPLKHLGHVQGKNIACVIGFCCYLFSRLDISPTTGDFLSDPMVTNEDKYWTQMGEMLQFEGNLTHPTLFSESLDYQGAIIYQAEAE